MPRKTLGEKVEDLTIKLETHLTEFEILKKIIYRIGSAILVGIIGILIKLYWKYISSPALVGNVIVSLFNHT
jgi:hypothetical protein